MVSLRVLLVEDSDVYAHLVRSMLGVAKAAEFQVDRVSSIAEFREAFEKQRPDAVLLDLTLPDSQGLNTLRTVVDAVEGVPILVLTSEDDEAVSLEALREGAADYLVKSEVSANWLSRAILYAVERHRIDLASPDKESTPAVALLSIRDVNEDGSIYRVQFTQRRLVNVIVMDRAKDRLLSLIKRPQVRQIILDFSDVDYVANAAISMLLIIQKRAKAKGCQLTLDNVSPSVFENLHTRRFDKVFEIRTSQPTQQSNSTLDERSADSNSNSAD